MSTIVNKQPEPQGDGPRVAPSHTSAQQHFGSFDAATAIAKLEERVAALEAALEKR
jgi:hypothetical protein